jgi:hypothetical protein
VVVQDLEYAQRRAEGQAQDGEDAQGTADLLAFLGLDEAAAVGGLGEDLGEAGGERCWFWKARRSSLAGPWAVRCRRQ